MILKNAHFTVDGTDLSGNVKQLSFDRTVETQDDTTMGNDSRTKEAGLQDASGSITFKQDFSAGSVDDTISALLGSLVAFAIRPDNAAVSATNPEWQGTLIVTSYNPVAGGVGESQEATINFDVTGDVTRAVA